MSIEVRNVSKSFLEKKILDNVSFVLEEGEFACLMAPSGKGKTTMTRMLLSLETPDSGEIVGVPRRTAAVFQEDRLCESLSVSKNIRIACPNVGIDEIKAHLSYVGLYGIEKQKARELSGGQKRRVALVRAVLSKADFTVFDEPFSGLDEETRKIVIKYMKNNLKGSLSLVVTHDIDDAAALGAKVIKL